MEQPHSPQEIDFTQLSPEDLEAQLAAVFDDAEVAGVDLGIDEKDVRANVPEHWDANKDRRLAHEAAAEKKRQNEEKAAAAAEKKRLEDEAAAEAARVAERAANLQRIADLAAAELQRRKDEMAAKAASLVAELKRRKEALREGTESLFGTPDNPNPHAQEYLAERPTALESVEEPKGDTNGHTVSSGKVRHTPHGESMKPMIDEYGPLYKDGLTTDKAKLEAAGVKPENMPIQALSSTELIGKWAVAEVLDDQTSVNDIQDELLDRLVDLKHVDEREKERMFNAQVSAMERAREEYKASLLTITPEQLAQLSENQRNIVNTERADYVKNMTPERFGNLNDDQQATVRREQARQEQELEKERQRQLDAKQADLERIIGLPESEQDEAVSRMTRDEYDEFAEFRRRRAMDAQHDAENQKHAAWEGLLGLGDIAFYEKRDAMDGNEALEFDQWYIARNADHWDYIRNIPLGDKQYDDAVAGMRRFEHEAFKAYESRNRPTPDDPQGGYPQNPNDRGGNGASRPLPYNPGPDSPPLPMPGSTGRSPRGPRPPTSYRPTGPRVTPAPAPASGRTQNGYDDAPATPHVTPGEQRAAERAAMHLGERAADSAGRWPSGITTASHQPSTRPSVTRNGFSAIRSGLRAVKQYFGLEGK